MYHVKRFVKDYWSALAVELADWTWRLLVNRVDVWGRYGDNCTYTAPAVSKRGAVLLTEADVARHFRPVYRGDILGLHTTSPDNLSRWLAVDVDHHGPGGNDAKANLAAAIAWYDRAKYLGFRPVLTTSNGVGGYHLRIIFREAITTPKVFNFAKWLVQDHGRHGLPSAPETFPKQAVIKPGGCGNWLRLPGRHYKHDHWSCVWDGTKWLDGANAVAFILSLTGDAPTLIPADADRFPRQSTPQPVRRPAPLPVGTPEARRIAAYLAKLPNLGEGQGRDDVAYRFAAFLVRDLQLPDAIALLWLARWDLGNTPPKGQDRLLEIIKSAHTYGRHCYGEGVVRDRPGHSHIRFTMEV